MPESGWKPAHFTKKEFVAPATYSVNMAANPNIAAYIMRRECRAVLNGSKSGNQTAAQTEEKDSDEL